MEPSRKMVIYICGVTDRPRMMQTQLAHCVDMLLSDLVPGCMKLGGVTQLAPSSDGLKSITSAHFDVMFIGFDSSLTSLYEQTNEFYPNYII